MLSISQLAKENGISVRMLRYYDEKGVLMPAYRDNAGIRYYENTAAEQLHMISILLSFGFSIEEIRHLQNQKMFHPEQARVLLDAQKKELIRQRDRLERQIKALEEIRAADPGEPRNWQELAESLQQNYVDSHMIAVHKTGIRVDTDFYRRFGSPVQPWTRWLMEPVHFDHPEMKMCEVNACYTDLWEAMEERLPKGRIDLFDDPRIHHSQHVLEKEGLLMTWLPGSTLKEHTGEYDLIINDHLGFYGKHFEEGLADCYNALKDDGVFFCTHADPETRKQLSEWETYINPMNYYHLTAQKSRRRFASLQRYLKTVYRSVTYHERFKTIQMDDPDALLEDIKTKASYNKSDTAMRKRYERIENQIRKLFQKQGYLTMESRYYVIEARK